MSSAIIVTKAQIDKKPFVLLQINSLCDSIFHQDELMTIHPRDGKVNELIKILKFHQIHYRGNYNKEYLSSY